MLISVPLLYVFFFFLLACFAISASLFDHNNWFSLICYQLGTFGLFFAPLGRPTWLFRTVGI